MCTGQQFLDVLNAAADAPAVCDVVEQLDDFVVFEVDSSGGAAKNEVVVRFSAASFDARGTMISVSSQHWRLPRARRVHRRASAKHGVSMRDLQAHGFPALEQLDVVDALLHDFHRRRVKVVSHDAKFTTRLLEQTAVAHMANWKLPHLIFCLKTASRLILNIRGMSSRTPRPPTATELYRYLHKRRPPAELVENVPVSSMKLTALNFVAARARGWV